MASKLIRISEENYQRIVELGNKTSTFNDKSTFNDIVDEIMERAALTGGSAVAKAKSKKEK